MQIQIKSRWTGAVLFETDAETIGDAINAAIVAKADLRWANLSKADLRWADLSGANLRGANLRGANLSKADLRWADLSGANLRGANLSKADLSGANLSGANLSGANLRGADLRGADLRGECLALAISQRSIVAEGAIIGWKKLQDGVICKLLIPAEAHRIGGLVGRKCRAEYAKVLSGEGFSQRNGMEYKKGAIVRPDKYDPNPLVECSNGIHFFITREEAEWY